MSRTLVSVRRWLPIAVAVVVIDQLSKRWALSALADGRVIDLVGPSRFVLSFNTGVAFGQGRGRGLGPVIAAVGLIVVVGLVTSIGRRSGRAAQYAVGLIVGGAIGNIIDRCTQPPGWLRGGVVDFIQVVDWFPIFNVADMAITIGGIALVVALMRQQRLETSALTATGDDDSSTAGTPAASGDERDAGTTDAGPTDAGPTDPGTTDAGPTDAGPTDAGTVEAESNGRDLDETGATDPADAASR